MTRGAANGNSIVGVAAALTRVFAPPAVSTKSLPIHSMSASTSVYDAMLAGTTHSDAPLRALSR